jgi:Fic family protein
MQNSSIVKNFHELPLPEENCLLVGYAALIGSYKLEVPLPKRLSVIGQKHKKYETEMWLIFTPRHKPKETLAGHLTFALKYEGIDLAVLHALFKKIDPLDLTSWIELEPIGQYSRKIWFLYEWLMDLKLLLPDLKKGNYINLIDENQQFAGPTELSRRHRIKNNLPGVPHFCPLVRKTEKLKKFIKLKLDKVAIEKIKSIRKDIINRAASFLLLKDSRASFEIEKEHPSNTRAERWGKVISEAGIHALSIDEIVRLQSILIEDHRFVFLGLRNEGGFIGVHDRTTQLPIPDHISANPNDLWLLMNGLIDTNRRFIKTKNIDPVVLAAIISFGFVYIHPFIDGNGRIHRYLIHHILAEQGFSSKNFIFPISAVMLDHIEEYKQVLESFSRSRLRFISWRPTKNGNLEVLNETIDLYRYFDATKEAEFLYDCVLQTIEDILPKEMDYLEKYDRMKTAIIERFDMPDQLIDLLIKFLQQNNGKISKRARQKEFKALSEQESQEIEMLFTEIFYNMNYGHQKL